MNTSISTRMSQTWLLLLLLCLCCQPSHQCKSSPASPAPAKSNPTTDESTIKGIIRLKQPQRKGTNFGEGSSQAGY